MSELDKLLSYFDKEFIREKVELDNRGMMGTHYDGLILNDYLDNSIFQYDYLDIEDYFRAEANVSYCDNECLFEQYSKLPEKSKIKVISAVLSLVKISSYEAERSNDLITKATNFLERYGLHIEYKDEKFDISTERKLFEGSYCDVLYYDEGILKKRLKQSYAVEEKWRRRFKIEYDNMVELAQSPHVLKVFGYSEEENSYLMEKCDCDLYEYIEKNSLFIDDNRTIEIANSIIEGLMDVHSKGIIHRDLHLGNVLFKNEEVIISDFGLSKDMMNVHSFQSSATPKNSNMFVDPVGLTDFRLLDKQSDIYSLGKVLEYLLRNTAPDLFGQVNLVLDKATNRDKKKRYKSLEELRIDFNSTISDIDEEERINQVHAKMVKGEYSPDVEKYILTLIDNNQLSYALVEHKDYQMSRILLQMDEVDQENALKSIDDNYAEATGYGHFENYDRFGDIMYTFILNSKNISLQRAATRILEGCASYRYHSKELLDTVRTKFPQLNVSE